MQLNQDVVKINKEIEQAELTEEQVSELATQSVQQMGNDPLDTPELNQAAYMFQSSVPRIKALAGNMSRNGLARVFKAIVEFPLAPSYPKFKGVEQELFNLTLSAIAAKGVMTNAFMAQHGKQITQEAEAGIVQEVLDSQKEEANG